MGGSGVYGNVKERDMEEKGGRWVVGASYIYLSEEDLSVEAGGRRSILLPPS